MRCLLGLITAVFVFASTCSAEVVPCRVGKSYVVGHADQIAVYRVTFLERSGEVEASVFIPDSEVPVPGIIFSHSAIQGPSARTDLQRFALALARAGAASIVLDGTIEWLTPNDKFKKPAPRTLACAGQWLLLNANMDRHRLATAGTLNGWFGGDTPGCVFEVTWGTPCWATRAVLNFGETSRAEWDNTNAMLTLHGQLQMARFAQRNLDLGEVKPEWLAENAVRK